MREASGKIQVTRCPIRQPLREMNWMAKMESLCWALRFAVTTCTQVGHTGALSSNLTLA